MSIDKTGGAAFPYTEEWYDGSDIPAREIHEGMTLRDYFAAKAMQTMIGMINAKTPQDEIERIPKSSYQYADDMIKEREKPIDEEDKLICLQCNGSGEGMHDGTKCTSCKGSGIEK